MAEYVMATADEWEGLYVNGELKHQGHHVQLYEVMRWVMEIPPSSYASYEVDYAWCENRGDLPDKIEDVVWLKR